MTNSTQRDIDERINKIYKEQTVKIQSHMNDDDEFSMTNSRYIDMEEINKVKQPK